MNLPEIVQVLRAFYGPPAPPQVTNALELILWENIAYLVDDETRAAAYRLLKERVGTTPEQILAASDATLLEVARAGGMLPEQRVRKLRLIAQLTLSDFDDNLNLNLNSSPSQAKRALKKFPGIGEPGAEKILLFSGIQPLLALDSNGLRVLLRLGFGEEKKDYAATYRTVQHAVKDQISQDFAWLIEAHQLLRQHGQETCKRNSPRCETCPLQISCCYYQLI